MGIGARPALSGIRALVCLGLMCASSGALADAALADVAQFMESLRATGAPVARVGVAEQPFLPREGALLKVHGEDVQVFQFRSAAEVGSKADTVSPDGGTVGKAKIHWIGAPHFYRNGRLLVLYVGDDPRVLKSLREVLGAQFAGR